MSRIVVFLAIFLFSIVAHSDDSLDQLVRNVAAAKLNIFGNEVLLPAEEAFQFSASIKNANTLSVHWKIAPDYYLYREKIKLELVNSEGTKLEDYHVPNGLPKYDEAFGDVQIFYDNLDFELPVLREDHNSQTVKLRAYFQGCAERGVCYPPMTQDVMLNFPVAHSLEALPESEGQNFVLNKPILILLIFSMVVFVLTSIIAVQLKARK